MKSKEQFWNEATVDRMVFQGADHFYFIDNGCKVEYYEDKTLCLYNTMIGGDFYQKLPDEAIDTFLELGFDVASLQMAIKTIDSIVSVPEGDIDPSSKSAANEYGRMRKKYCERLYNLLQAKNES